MALIPAYQAKLQQIAATCEHGGFEIATGTFTPFKKMDGVGVYQILDVITAATEAGALDNERWISQIFASTEIFEAFLKEYADYDDGFRTYDRWYWALFRLAGHDDGDDEVAFVTSSEIAKKLRDVAQDSGQI